VTAWYERDDFWEIMAPKLFGRGQWTKAPAEVDNVVRLLGISRGAHVLDLGCGPGRHSTELARRGFQVTGVDRTVTYLEQARQRAEQDGLNIELVNADMRQFRRPGTYDAVVNLYTTFGFFEDPEDDRRVLDNIHASLKTGGKLLMEMMGKEILARTFRERDWLEVDGVVFLEERKLSPNWDHIDSRWIMVDGNGRREFTFSLRLYSAAELCSVLTRSGLHSIDIFGGLSGTPYDHTANRLVAVAAK